MNNIFIKIIVFAILLNIGCGIEQVLSDKIDLNNEINDEKTDLNKFNGYLFENRCKSNGLT